MRNRNIPFLYKVPQVNIVHGRVNYVLEQCHHKVVLHLGFVDEGLTEERIKNKELLHLKLLEVCRELYGVDISEKGVKLLKNKGVPNLYVGNIERLNEIPQIREKEYDLILACEVIEHLSNPGLFLNSVKSLFSDKTRMIITVPNAFKIPKIKYLFQGYELVHGDHNYWFSYKTLSTLLSKHNYDIHEILVYSFGTWKLFQKNIQNTPLGVLKRTTETLKTIIRSYLYKRNPFWADGLIFLVSPQKH